MKSRLRINSALIGRARFSRCVIGLLSLLLLAACSRLPERNPVPTEQIYQVQPVPGIPAIRAFGGTFSRQFEEDLIHSLHQEGLVGLIQSGAPLPDVNVLSLSGGADYGAFGAGFLNGWTQSGTRPNFKVVTGISTGALIAPFAFLGPDYDAALREVYTTIGPEDIFQERGFRGVLWSDAFADSAPLYQLIERYFDVPMIEAVARAHAQGRRLYIGTTNLDADELVVWNMGAIASSGHPGAVELFRKVVLASSSVPGLFPPVLIEVHADGSTYDEMHVDGGVKTQLFVTAATMEVSRIKAQVALEGESAAQVSIYVIRNGVVRPVAKPVPRTTTDISQRAVASMIRSQVQHDLEQVHRFAHENDFAFNWVSLPNEHAVEEGKFNTVEMNRLFAVGLTMGLGAKSGWNKDI